MDFDFFSRQMSRLSDTFGGNHYKDERIKIIWGNVKDLSHGWFSNVVNYFIGNSRQAPLMPEFNDEISKERERLYRIEKETRTEEIESFMASYGLEDIQTICHQIRKRLQGGMSDEDFECFQKMLSAQGAFKCERCHDTRIYHDGKGLTLCNHRA
jgi:hypothetical protein